MFSHDEIFREIFRGKHLRVYDPTKSALGRLEKGLLELARIHLKALLDTCSAGLGSQMPAFHFEYVDCPIMQAHAFYVEQSRSGQVVDKCGYIGMYTGMVCLIYDMFYRMLAHPKILPTVGNAAAELETDPYCSEGLPENYQKLLQGRGVHGRNGLLAVLPKDPQRREYAEQLARLALQFLAIHEFAHIKDGHCEYANPNKTILLSELNAKASRTALDPVTQQALEITADAYAFVFTWQMNLIGTDAAKQKRGLLESGNSVVVPDELLMFDWLFAIYCMFWLFGQSVDMNNYQLDTHPSPPQRATLAYAKINGMLEQHRPKMAEKLAQFDRTFPKAYEAGFNAIAHISDGMLVEKVKLFVDAREDGRLNRHFLRVVERWEAIKDDVRQYCHPPGERPSRPQIQPQMPPIAAS